jgi:hypothetical protein
MAEKWTAPQSIHSTHPSPQSIVPFKNHARQHTRGAAIEACEKRWVTQYEVGHKSKLCDFIVRGGCTNPNCTFSHHPHLVLQACKGGNVALSDGAQEYWRKANNQLWLLAWGDVEQNSVLFKFVETWLASDVVLSVHTRLVEEAERTKVVDTLLERAIALGAETFHGKDFIPKAVDEFVKPVAGGALAEHFDLKRLVDDASFTQELMANAEAANNVGQFIEAFWCKVSLLETYARDNGSKPQTSKSAKRQQKMERTLTEFLHRGGNVKQDLAPLFRCLGVSLAEAPGVLTGGVALAEPPGEAEAAGLARNTATFVPQKTRSGQRMQRVHSEGPNDIVAQDTEQQEALATVDCLDDAPEDKLAGADGSESEIENILPIVAADEPTPEAPPEFVRRFAGVVVLHPPFSETEFYIRLSRVEDDAAVRELLTALCLEAEAVRASGGRSPCVDRLSLQACCRDGEARPERGSTVTFKVAEIKRAGMSRFQAEDVQVLAASRRVYQGVVVQHSGASEPDLFLIGSADEHFRKEVLRRLVEGFVLQSFGSQSVAAGTRDATWIKAHVSVAYGMTQLPAEGTHVEFTVSSEVDEPPRVTWVALRRGAPAGSKVKKIHIFHDAENCYLSNAFTLDANKLVSNTLASIRAAAECSSFTDFEWRMFLNRYNPDEKNTPRPSFLPAATKRDALLQEGITIIDCGRKQGAVDMHLKEQLGTFVDDTESPTSRLVVIISGDTDFAGEYRKLKSARFPCMMLHRECLNTVAGLEAVPDFVCPEWDRIVAIAGGNMYRFCPFGKECKCSLEHSDGVVGSFLHEQCREAAARTPCGYSRWCHGLKPPADPSYRECLFDHTDGRSRFTAPKVGDIVQARLEVPKVPARLSTGWAYAKVNSVDVDFAVVTPLGLGDTSKVYSNVCSPAIRPASHSILMPHRSVSSPRSRLTSFGFVDRRVRWALSARATCVFRSACVSTTIMSAVHASLYVCLYHTSASSPPHRPLSAQPTTAVDTGTHARTAQRARTPIALAHTCGRARTCAHTHARTHAHTHAHTHTHAGKRPPHPPCDCQAAGQAMGEVQPVRHGRGRRNAGARMRASAHAHRQRRTHAAHAHTHVHTRGRTRAHVHSRARVHRQRRFTSPSLRRRAPRRRAWMWQVGTRNARNTWDTGRWYSGPWA